MIKTFAHVSFFFNVFIVEINRSQNLKNEYNTKAMLIVQKIEII